MNRKFLLVFCIVFSIFCLKTTQVNADTVNPFSVKKDTEFTKEDMDRIQEKFRKNVQEVEVNLQQEMSRKINSLEQKMEEKLRNSVVKPVSPDGKNMGDLSAGMDVSRFEKVEGDDILKEWEEFTEDNLSEEMKRKIKRSVFVGCFDNQVLFKDSRNNEQFFVPIKEVENNEEFIKMGGCGF